MAVGIGENPHRDENGHYGYTRFTERYPLWPSQAAQLAGLVTEFADRADVFICPSLSWNPLRDSSRRRVLPGRWLWADLDHGNVPLDVSYNGGFLVNSGTPGHLHVYVKLAEPQPAEVIETFNRRLVRHLESDPSPSALSGFLRPAGSVNHKTDETAPVELGYTSAGDGWDLAELGQLLPSDRKSSSHIATTAFGHTLELDTPIGQRSERFYRLVFMAYTSGIAFEETVATLSSHQPSADKYGDRLAGEVWRC